jgi:putative Ca2+/H+ antiporter (TMEM165/GDT1 family)
VGLSFFGFALWSLRGDTLGDNEPSRDVPVFGAFGVVAGSFFLSELGDKTQLATVTLAGDRPEAVAVWLGSTAGMVVADAAAIAVGIIAGGRLPQRVIAVGAAVMFVAFGVVALWRGIA